MHVSFTAVYISSYLMLSYISIRSRGQGASSILDRRPRTPERIGSAAVIYSEGALSCTENHSTHTRCLCWQNLILARRLYAAPHLGSATHGTRFIWCAVTGRISVLELMATALY